MAAFLRHDPVPVVFGAKVVRNLPVRQALLKQGINPLFPANGAKILNQQLIHILVGDAQRDGNGGVQRFLLRNSRRAGRFRIRPSLGGLVI